MRHERRFAKKMDSLEEIFLFVEEFIEREGLGPKEAFILDLVVEELFTNMVKHNFGAGHPVSIGLDRVDRQLRLSLRDEDVDPFDPASVGEAPIGEPVEKREPGGLGLHLVRSMVDEVSYEYEDRNMTISVVKELS